MRIQIERAIVENRNLELELEQLIQNIKILTANARSMDTEVNKSMEYVKNRVKEADVNVADLFALING